MLYSSFSKDVIIFLRFIVIVFSMVKLWQAISIHSFQSLPKDFLVYCTCCMISVEATIRIGHEEVFLNES